MQLIGLIKETKQPQDTRVALTPKQCKYFNDQYPDKKVIVQSSQDRCFSDDEYRAQGIEVREDVSDCEILLGIKEIKTKDLLPGKTYFFFSHTKKLQPYNREMMQDIIRKKITLIDYECLAFEDGARIIGFGFFAGVVGAHNGFLELRKAHRSIRTQACA